MDERQWNEQGSLNAFGGAPAFVFMVVRVGSLRGRFVNFSFFDKRKNCEMLCHKEEQDGRLSPVYYGSAYAGDRVPTPRFDLVGPKQTVPLTLEVSRGCPFQCGFCALSSVGTRYHTRPMDKLVRDVTTGRQMLRGLVPDWKLKIAMLLDNNVGGSLSYLPGFCQTMESLDLLWGGAITFNVVADPRNARMLAQSGCRMLFTGLESFNPEAIQDMNKRQNNLDDTRRVIDSCHENGIALISALLLNAQVDTVEYIRNIPARLRQSGLMVPAFFSFECPLPGTPLFHRLAAAEQPAFLPNALLCDFNGYVMVQRPRRASVEAFVDAYRQTLAEVTSLQATLRQAWANTPGLLRRGQYAAALVDSLLHWSAVLRKPLPERTYITGSDVPMPELFDMPFEDSDFRSDEERRKILEPWRVTDGDGRVLPAWRHSDRLYGSKGLVKPTLALQQEALFAGS